MLVIAELPETLNRAFESRCPNHLCEYAYNVASPFNHFYHEHHILRESDKELQASWLQLSRITLSVLDLVLHLLGVEAPERM